MSKNINVQAHVKRYEATELSDVVALIAALNTLVEQRREQAIAEYEAKLNALRNGEVPVVEKPTPAPKRTRGGKAIAQSTEQA